jgi:hypothetical protein
MWPSRQILPRRRLDARGLRELRQEVLIALTGVAPDDAAQRRIRLQRRRIDADGLALHQTRVGELLQHPGEDRLVGLEINQAARARNRRMVGRRLGQHQPEKFAQRKRISRPPRDPAFRVQAFEIPDEQQPKVSTAWQPRSAVLRVESLADSLDVPVEVMLLKDLIQSRVERMRSATRQVVRHHPHRCLFRASPSFAHRHRRQCSTRDRSSRSLIHRFTSSCSQDGRRQNADCQLGDARYEVQSCWHSDNDSL